MTTVEELPLSLSPDLQPTAWRVALLANMATREMLDDLWNGEDHKDLDLYRAYDGVEIIDARDRIDDKNYRCLDYVFNTVQNEPWGRTGIWALEELTRGDWRSPEVLEAIGYQVVDNPERGDVVLYFLNYFFGHAGIFEGDDKVVSKLGSGPILRHPINLVPAIYGSDITFLRKTVAEQS